MRGCRQDPIQPIVSLEVVLGLVDHPLEIAAARRNLDNRFLARRSERRPFGPRHISWLAPSSLEHERCLVGGKIPPFKMKTARTEVIEGPLSNHLVTEGSARCSISTRRLRPNSVWAVMRRTRPTSASNRNRSAAASIGRVSHETETHLLDCWRRARVSTVQVPWWTSDSHASI